MGTKEGSGVGLSAVSFVPASQKDAAAIPHALKIRKALPYPKPRLASPIFPYKSGM
ncbi:hypothetical protein [Wandonia haliotis]|uniref:hypothetical protein n=1 Tax=Wandonia haliotis TaxID=574963 RepID=UPI0031D1B4B3